MIPHRCTRFSGRCTAARDLHTSSAKRRHVRLLSTVRGAQPRAGESDVRVGWPSRVQDSARVSDTRWGVPEENDPVGRILALVNPEPQKIIYFIMYDDTVHIVITTIIIMIDICCK